MGLRPTPSTSTIPSGTPAAAANQKAADEKSPGMSVSTGTRACPPRILVHSADDLHRRPELHQGALGVVPRLDCFAHRSLPLGREAGQQDGALDLRAGNLGRVGNAAQAPARHGHRQPSGRQFNARTHPFQWAGHAAHGSPAQRRIAREGGRERVSGEDSGEQARGGPGIARVEGARRGTQIPQTTSDKGEGRAARRERPPQGPGGTLRLRGSRRPGRTPGPGNVPTPRRPGSQPGG